MKLEVGDGNFAAPSAVLKSKGTAYIKKDSTKINDMLQKASTLLFSKAEPAPEVSRSSRRDSASSLDEAYEEEESHHIKKPKKKTIKKKVRSCSLIPLVGGFDTLIL